MKNVEFEPPGNEGIAEVRKRDDDPRVRLSLEAQASLKDNTNTAPSKYNDWVPAITLDERGCKQYSHWAVEIREGQQYTIQKGDTLRDVARRSLGVTGNPDATSKEISAEMKRIAALNSDLAPLVNRRHGTLPPGVVLKLQEAKPVALAPAAETTASENGGCPERERIVVRKGLIKAENCDRYELMENSAGIVRPGADVVVNGGARAFVFGGKVEARAGSRIITVGGDIQAHPTARIKYVSDAGISESHAIFPAFPELDDKASKKAEQKPLNGPQSDFSPA